MERLAAQPTFAESAFDQDKRDYDDITTLFAEMLEGNMRTPFSFYYDGQEIRGRDGKALREDFETGLEDADHIAEHSPQLAFEVRRRRSEIDEHYDMRKMAQGTLPNTMVVVSDFPAELMRAKEDVGGYNVTRKQTMLRVISWNDGEFHMHTQSLDGSHREALESMYQSLGYEARDGELLGQRMHLQLPSVGQELLVDQLTHTYDTALGHMFGGKWYAGRRDDSRLNTYDFVRQQRDIVQLALQQRKQGAVDYIAMAEALRKRFEDNRRAFPEQIIARQHQPFETLAAELSQARTAAQVMNRVFSACGMTLNALAETNTSEQLGSAGYGNKSDEDEKGPLTFKCKNGHTNRRPRGKLIKQCKIASCKDSVGC